MAEANYDPYWLVASIHIGTTHSSYAIGCKHALNKDQPEIYIPRWDDDDMYNTLSGKTSTTVLLNKKREFVAFGYEAENHYRRLVEREKNEDYYYFHRFKMLIHDKIRTTGLTLSTTIPDIRGKELPAVDVFSHAIRFLKNHFLQSNNFTERLLDDDICWILTIPAIWDTTGKQLLKEAAEKAEVHGVKVIIAYESEAALMYSIHFPLEKCYDLVEKTKNLEEGSKHLVLDIRDESIDITVYEAKTAESLKLLERASWGDCGETSVDKAFKEFLCDIVGGEEVLEGFIKSYPLEYNRLFHGFEFSKRKISEKTSEQRNITMLIPPVFAEEFPDIDFTNYPSYKYTLKLGDDKLKIPTKIFSGFFEPLSNGIIEHVNEVVRLPNDRGIRTIHMVSDFPTSVPLKDAMKKAFPNINIRTPENPSFAVASGALFLHDKEIYTDECIAGVKSKCIESDDTILLQIIPQAQKNNQSDGENGELSVSLFRSKKKNSRRLEESSCDYMGNLSVPVQNSTPVSNAEFKVTVVHGGQEKEFTMEVSTSGFKTDLKFNCA